MTLYIITPTSSVSGCRRNRYICVCLDICTYRGYRKSFDFSNSCCIDTLRIIRSNISVRNIYVRRNGIEHNRMGEQSGLYRLL